MSRPPPASPDFLGEHYAYEMNMLRYADDRLKAGLHPHEANAFIESFCLHARALAAFFAGHAVDQDLRVDDYAPGFRGTLEPAKLGKDSALFTRINRQIAHLTLDRGEDKISDDDRLLLRSALEDDHALFMAAVDEKYRAAIQGWLWQVGTGE